MKYLGDYAEDSTVRFFFSTNDSSGGRIGFSASLEAADVEIIKDGNITGSTAGVTITTDFDSKTGLHLIAVDMSADAFYATGSDYACLLYPNDETVDSQNVAAVIAEWSCENRFDEVDVTKVSGDATAADNLELDYDGTGYAKSNSTVGTVTTLTNKSDFRLSATGVDDIWDEQLSGHVAAGSAGAALYVVRSATAQAGAASTITLDASASASDDFYNNNPIWIVSGTGAGQGNTITDYNGTTKVATVQDSWVTNPSSDSVFVIIPRGGIPGASAPTAAAVADAVWDEAYADHTAEGTYGSMLQAAHQGTAQAGTASSITLDATGSSATDDFYLYAFVKIIAGTGAGQSRQISDYVGSSKVATVALDWTTVPSTDSQYIVTADLGIDAATVASIADGVWDEARAGHVAAGSFGEYVLADATRVTGSTTAATDLANGATGSTPFQVNVTQFGGNAAPATDQDGVPKVDISHVAGVAEDLPTATDMQTIDDNVDAVLEDTGTTLPATLGTPTDTNLATDIANVQTATDALPSAGEILTQQITESYAAQGVSPTLAQALMAIHQQMQDSVRVGTTVSVRNLAGATAFTITLDDAGNPTDVNRAT